MVSGSRGQKDKKEDHDDKDRQLLVPIGIGFYNPKTNGPFKGHPTFTKSYFILKNIMQYVCML